MKTRITKIILSSVLSVGIIAGTVFALNIVNTGDTVTASSWNEIVSKLTSLNTNSSDLVTKSYVDSAVAAAGGVTPGSIDWRDCNIKTRLGYGSVSCDAGYAMVMISNSTMDNQNSGKYVRYTLFGANEVFTTNDNNSYYVSIKCCKINQ